MSHCLNNVTCKVDVHLEDAKTIENGLTKLKYIL